MKKIYSTMMMLAMMVAALSFNTSKTYYNLSWQRNNLQPKNDKG